MTLLAKAGAVIGVVLMALGCAAPWASTREVASGTTLVGGLEHGAWIVLGLSVLLGLLILLGSRLLVALCALAAAAWTALVMYELPGTLLVGAIYQAEIAWGAYLALLGSVIVVGAAALPAPGRRTAFRTATRRLRVAREQLDHVPSGHQRRR